MQVHVAGPAYKGSGRVRVDWRHWPRPALQDPYPELQAREYLRASSLELRRVFLWTGTRRGLRGHAQAGQDLPGEFIHML